MKNRFTRIILLILTAGIFLFSSVMVLSYCMEMRNSQKAYEELTQMIVATVPQETQLQEEIAEEVTESEETIPEEEENYVKVVAPIQVDFEALLAQNSDVIGWLYSPETKINYPVVQAGDNEYYLNRLLNRQGNAGGTLFMDYRNNSDMTSWNSVIYGHNMNNKSMFGTLVYYKTQSYFDAHPEMYFLTPEGDYVVRFVAGFVAKSSDELFNSLNPGEEKKEELLQAWLEASSITSDVQPTTEDRFLTLSTCSYEFKNARYVLIGVLTDRAE